jgi:hypothetical protein
MLCNRLLSDILYNAHELKNMQDPWTTHPHLLPSLLKLYQNGMWRNRQALLGAFQSVSAGVKNVDIGAIYSEIFQCPDDSFRMSMAMYDDEGLNVQFSTAILDFMLSSPPYSLCPSTGAMMSHPVPLPKNKFELEQCDALSKACFANARAMIKAQCSEPRFDGPANQSPFNNDCVYEPKEHLCYWLHPDGASELHLLLAIIGHGDERCNVSITFNYHGHQLRA